MAVQKPTPEEKLFAVIQGAKQPPLRGRPQALSLATVGIRLSSLIGPLDLPRVNQWLTGLVIALGLLCLIGPFFMTPRMSRIIAQAHAPIPPFVVAPLDGIRPLEEYLQGMITQDPFRVGETPRASAPSGDTPPAVSDPRALVKDLQLVGISFGEKPVAMIERQQQTYVLKVGESLGEFTVKEILKDRVILHVGNQDLELF